jgi:hypothetical protein
VKHNGSRRYKIITYPLFIDKIFYAHHKAGDGKRFSQNFRIKIYVEEDEIEKSCGKFV